MHGNPLIQAPDLYAMLSGGPVKMLVLDCSFDLAQPAAGPEVHRQGHIPDAGYVHLDADLSGPKTGRNGRHPLPDADAFVRRMRSLGADDDTLIVAYDNAASMYAARLWWLLGWVGHGRRCVLDGGFAAWLAAGLPVQAGLGRAPAAGNFSRRPSAAEVVDRQFVLANIASGERIVIDARSAERFRGENETMDPQAGHIPGARNRPFQSNLGDGQRFKPAARLRSDFQEVMAGHPAERVVHQCGSGVTACHNALAMEIAGLPGSALYAGSWSEWSACEGSPIARGPD